MNTIRINQPRDINSVTQTRFLVNVLRLAPACALLGSALLGLVGLRRWKR